MVVNSVEFLQITKGTSVATNRNAMVQLNILNLFGLVRNRRNCVPNKHQLLTVGRFMAPNTAAAVRTAVVPVPGA